MKKYYFKQKTIVFAFFMKIYDYMR